ncbi:phytochrome-like protein cph2 [mine drainage metagenome]|uniref:Diguanylate cyclase DosC n=1 Tax=mine drainage metagenome TaxID=410659 RepID=A0A1J5R7M0_9ZZZZ
MEKILRKQASKPDDGFISYTWLAKSGKMKPLDELVGAIVKALNIDDAAITRRKAFLEFTDDDVAWLQKLHEASQAIASDFINAFYAHLLAFDETRAQLSDMQTLERLKRTQAGYFSSLTAGDYGQDYIYDRLRVGIAHQHAGLAPEWYLGAYNKYLTGLLPNIWEQFGKDPEAFIATCQALIKIVLLDIGLAIDTYIQADRQTILALKEYAEIVFANIPDGLMVLSSDLSILSVNCAFLKRFGLSEEAVHGRQLMEVIAAGELQERALEVLATRVAQHDVRFSVGLADCSERKPVRVTMTGIQLGEEEEKEEARLLLIVNDLTEEEALRAAALESERRFRNLAETAHDGIIMTDPRGAITYFNRAAERMFGHQRHQVLGRSVGTMLPELMLCQLNEELQRLPIWETQGKRQDGTALVVEGSSSVFEGSMGRFITYVLRDITAYKQAEQELRIAATTFEAQEGIIVTDANNVILRVNQAFTRLTGYNAEEVVGQTPAILESGRQDSQFYRDMQDSINLNKYWQGEIWNRHKNGEICPEWLSITAVTKPNGEVTNFVASFTDISQYKKAEEEIHNLAFYDPLTGLPNRRLLLDRLGQAFATSTRSNAHGAILFLDLDNFKTLNDTKGHDGGDLLLIEVAKRLQACVREGDTVARLGGDEFVVMLEDLNEMVQQSATQAEVVGEKIRDDINQPYLLQGHKYNITASIGISLFRGHEVSIDDLLKHADTAMYQSKTSGRNTLRFYDPAMQEALEVRAAMELDLRHAMSEQQFRLYFQIQVDHARHIVGAEALLRWEHSERGLISPAQFIPLAEETGLILPIGNWVLETACTLLKTWETNPLTRDLQLAVNVSARQFKQPDFVERVSTLLTQTGANPERLKLELTESLMLDDVTHTIEKMQVLKSLGVHFSMDDFGTGYSSLSYLKRLPLNQLKIDQSFVRDLATDPSDAVIVQTIIGMANSLGLNVIAEGVETESQFEFLKQHGCPSFQGYLFSRPMPLMEFEEFLCGRHIKGSFISSVA